MELEQAITILKDSVATDRKVRKGRMTEDIDQWAERQCIAIERVLEEIENGRTS